MDKSSLSMVDGQLTRFYMKTCLLAGHFFVSSSVSNFFSNFFIPKYTKKYEPFKINLWYNLVIHFDKRMIKFSSPFYKSIFRRIKMDDFLIILTLIPLILLIFIIKLMMEIRNYTKILTEQNKAIFKKLKEINDKS